MSLARMWRRQLYGASSAALIVPSAMLAALAVLALGGGFSGLRVLGQIFAGPSIPNPGPIAAGGPGARATRSAGNATAVIPATGFVAARAVPHGGGAGGGAGVPAPRTAVTRTGLSSTGGAVGQGGLTTRSVATRPVTTRPTPASPQPPASAAPQTSTSASPPPATSPTPAPAPGPSPQPTPVDQVVTVVTSVTSQVPGPVGSTATNVVQAAGSAADKLLP